MEVACPNCHARYRVAEDALPPEGREIACAQCGGRWHQAGLPTLEAMPDPEPLGMGVADAGVLDMNVGLPTPGPAAEAGPLFDEEPARRGGGLGTVGWLLILVLLGVAAALAYGVYSGQLIF